MISPLARSPQVFSSFFRPALCSKRMFCNRFSKSDPTPTASCKNDWSKAFKGKTVEQIQNDPQLLAELGKMYEMQSEDQDFKEITYENTVRFLSKFSDEDPVAFLLSKGMPPPIPGLICQPNFLDQNTLKSLHTQALDLHDKICTHREGATAHKSQGHNLPFERHYKLLHFEDIPERKINAQSFVDYGSPGHELTYFIDNQNVPSFIHENLVTRIKQMEPLQILASQLKRFLNWRFTFNVYKESGAKQAGFDWHKDIATNGEITSITTLFGTATFQIRPEDKTSYSATYSIPLTPGSIVLLSGDSRWKWEHRVLPKDSALENKIGRISLVLGCK